MAKDERKRQKALAKKKKREIKVRKEANKVRNPTPQDLVKAMQRGAWHACYEIDGDSGLHNIFCVRNSSMGPIVCSFLVDLYCLGVKDAAVLKGIDLVKLTEYVNEQDGRTVTPAYVLKLITFAIEEARKIGFEPHRTTAISLPIFFDVDASECKDTFEFGRDGKPTYIAGPFETDFQQFDILNTLSKLGGTNFNFISSLTSAEIADGNSFRAYEFVRDDDEDADDFDDYDDFEDDDDSNESRTIDSTAKVVDVQTKE